MVKRILLLSVALLGTAAYLARASRPEEIPARESLANLPMSLAGWQGRDAAELDTQVLKILGVDDYVNRFYYMPGRGSVGLYIGYYRSQRQGDTIHSPLNCLPGSGWNPIRRGVVEIPAADSTVSAAPPVRINRIVILKGAEKQIALYWYQSHGRVVASEYWGKIYTVLDALRTNRTDAALVRVMSPVRDSSLAAEIEAERNALDFVLGLFPILSRFLPA